MSRFAQGIMVFCDITNFDAPFPIFTYCKMMNDQKIDSVFLICALFILVYLYEMYHLFHMH